MTTMTTGVIIWRSARGGGSIGLWPWGGLSVRSHLGCEEVMTGDMGCGMVMGIKGEKSDEKCGFFY